ncbi:uncharacterized protein [Lolium perenne]|uniref:uncharacterized protein n=1 Tax=Lolium perenne TaxID=4522 RepID=UPI0021F627E3|nr:uncharacterized protein LOC127308119 isoform X2 [Lolium perenne]XP_051194856.1 uncharacterized protein LOC127308119 isoform X2 [Lolium perenne]
MADPKTKKIGTRAYLQWTPEMDTALLDTLVEHHNNGDTAQNGWKPHTYTACIKHVKETCDVDITKDKIQARIKTFDKHYEIISKMLAQSGFGWDSEKNMVEVYSDEVWSRYVEANKEAAGYRNKVVTNWHAIQTIYSKDHATGVGATTAVESVQEQFTPVPGESPEVPQKRQRTGEAILCMMGEMRTSFDEALKATEPLPMPKVTPPTEIYDALKKLSLEESDLLRAYGKLIINERLFEALKALPEEIKKPWLLSLP